MSDLTVGVRRGRPSPGRPDTTTGGWAHSGTNGCGGGASDERVTYEQQEVTGRDAPYPGGQELLRVPRSGYGPRDRRARRVSRAKTGGAGRRRAAQRRL